MQLVGGANGMPGLVPQQLHAPALVASLHLIHLSGLELGQARVGEVKGNGDARDAVGGKPLLGQPAMGPETQSPVLQFVIELMDAGEQGRFFQAQFQAGKFHRQQIFVPEIYPVRLFIAPSRHGRGSGTIPKFHLMTALAPIRGLSCPQTIPPLMLITCPVI